jgi:hypothetical protein
MKGCWPMAIHTRTGSLDVIEEGCRRGSGGLRTVSSIPRRQSSVVILPLLFLLIAAPVAANEAALYYLPGAQLEYEGTGYREVSNGWELKVKPRSSAAGLRWRHRLTENWSMQAQHWRNQAFYAREDGNAFNDALRQTGQTRLSLRNFLVDVRHPLGGSLVEAVAGTQAVYATFQRRDIVYNLAPAAGSPKERLAGYGAFFGLHGVKPGKRFYLDWELLFGHLFFTRNKQNAAGGSIRDDGYTYSARIEGGVRVGRWSVGVGYFRQLAQIMVPGGKTLPSGAVSSLPINKIDFFSPLATVRYEY